MLHLRILLLTVISAAASCTGPDPLYCAAEGDCDPGFFCDLTAEFDDLRHTCVSCDLAPERCTGPDAPGFDAPPPDAPCIPSAEICDGLDNDCDGDFDEDFAQKGGACEKGVGKCKADGVFVCTMDGSGVTCNAMEGTPDAMETCGNSVDDDCNGTPDDGCACSPGMVLGCGSDVGECMAGTQTCQMDGQWGPCNDVGPTAEVCDGLDNDCNGTPDDPCRILSVAVTGTGTVTSSPAGIDCPGDCSEKYMMGTGVTLTATAPGGWRFTGWSGDCTGTGTCNLNMDAAKSVTATFQRIHTLTVTKNGTGSGGTITSSPAGISCPGACSYDFIEGTSVTLTATETTGNTFMGWTGSGCSGLSTCVLSMTAPRSVTATFNTAGEHLWSRNNGNNNGQEGTAVAADSSGNVYVVGKFAESVSFGGASVTSAGGLDLFVAKLSPSGSQSWIVRFGTTGDDTASAITADTDGNVYVTGSYQGSITLGGATYPGPGALLLKLNATSGALVWGVAMTGTVGAEDVAIDTTGTIVVTGSFANTVNFGGGFASSSGGSSDAFVMWRTPAGGLLSLAVYGSTGEDSGLAVAASSSGRVFVAGTFSGTVDFNGATPGGSLTSVNSYDSFLLRTGAGDALDWVKGLAGADVYALSPDGSGGVWSAGGFSGTVNFGGGPLTATESDPFVARYSVTGTHLHSSRFEAGAVRGIAADPARGNITIIGSYSGVADFGGPSIPAVGGLSDIYVANLTASGAHRWSRGFGDDGELFGNSDAGFGVTLGPGGEAIGTGRFWGTMDAGGGSMTAGSPYDVFVVRYGP